MHINVLLFLAYAKQANASTGLNAGVFFIKHSALLKDKVTVLVCQSQFLRRAEFITYLHSSITALLIICPGNSRKVLRKKLKALQPISSKLTLFHREASSKP